METVTLNSIFSMMVCFIDEKRASFGIEDVDNTEWSEMSFSKGLYDSKADYTYCT